MKARSREYDMFVTHRAVDFGMGENEDTGRRAW